VTGPFVCLNWGFPPLLRLRLRYAPAQDAVAVALPTERIGTDSVLIRYKGGTTKTLLCSRARIGRRGARTGSSHVHAAYDLTAALVSLPRLSSTPLMRSPAPLTNSSARETIRAASFEGLGIGIRPRKASPIV